MTTDDPIGDLTHEHAELNRQIVELGALLSGRSRSQRTMIEILGDLREQLFLHFAREEEGLFPFVADQLPELAERVHAMALGHDMICGVVARMYHMLSVNPDPAALLPFFERFESAYGGHAKVEAELLRSLQGRLDPDQRAKLSALVRDL